MTESSKKRPSKSLNNSISSTPLKPSAKMVKVSDESDVSISKLFELVSLKHFLCFCFESLKSINLITNLIKHKITLS